MRSKPRLAGGMLGSMLCLVSLTTAQALVADLNPTRSATDPGSNPSGIWSLGNVAVLVANDGRHGAEPWRTDGTAAGTALLADTLPGSAGTVLTLTAPTIASGVLYFVAQVTGTPALWRTDGTAAGTTMLRSFGNTTAVATWHLTAVGSRVFFTVDDDVHGVELWQTDGTPAGTTLVVDLTPGSGGSAVHNLAALGNEVLFVARPAASTQLWRSDGTIAGTTLVYDFGAVATPFEDVGRFAKLGNQLCFVGWDATAGNEPWRTDGTPTGTFRLADISPGRTSSTIYIMADVVATDRAVFFAADDAVHGNELWTTDGTVLGTAMVADLSTGSSAPRSLRPFGSTLLFAADDGVHGQEPWSSDGTATGTRMLRDVRAGASGSRAQAFTAAGSFAVFIADDGTHGLEPWRTDGTTAGTALLRDLLPGTATSDSTPMASHAGGVLFAADDGVVGKELWWTDGTTAGTMLVADIAPPPAAGSTIVQLTRFGDRLAFTADDGAHGQEPWLSDGTAAGTTLLADLAPGAAGSTPKFVTAFAGGLLLGAYVPGQGWTLLRSDGTTAGTQSVGVVNATAAQSPGIWFAPLGQLGDRMLLALDDGVHGIEPWLTDGTTAGTVLLADLMPGVASAVPRGSRVVGDAMYFFTGSGFPVDAGVWKTDGTAAGTVRLTGLVSLPSPSYELVPVVGAVLFACNDGTRGGELWRTDGTVAGTGLLLELRPGSTGSDPRDFVALDGVALFTADDGVHGRELWRSDGTVAGTYLVADLNATAASSPQELTVADDLVFFRANNGIAGVELWRTDGTTAGTVLVRDLLPGSGGANPTAIRAVGSGRNVVFQATEPAHGKEVWTSDGTAAGTTLLGDLEAGPFDASPIDFMPVGTQVFFLATTTALGQELYVMPLAATGAPLVEVFGRGCAGSSGRVPSMGVASLPTVGNATFAFTLQAARPGVPVGLHLSPLAGALTFPPCTAYLLAPYASLLSATDAFGSAIFAAPIPPVVDLAGLVLHAQCTVLDAVGARALTLSDALRLELGR